MYNHKKHARCLGRIFQVSISRVFLAEKKRHCKHPVKVGNPATDRTHPSRCQKIMRDRFSYDFFFMIDFH